jgi:hypothetical protein
MFGEMQVTRVQQLIREHTLDEAAAKLLEFADYPRILRWYQFATALVVFLDYMSQTPAHILDGTLLRKMLLIVNVAC